MKSKLSIKKEKIIELRSMLKNFKEAGYENKEIAEALDTQESVTSSIITYGVAYSIGMDKLDKILELAKFFEIEK